MKILYFDLPMGAAGDMISAALFDLVEDKALALEKLHALAAALPGVEFGVEDSKRGSISGKHFNVSVNGEEEFASGDERIFEAREGKRPHRKRTGGLGPKQIAEAVTTLPVSEGVKTAVNDVYALITDAESKVHGESVELVHFHELGALDAVFDVAAACLLMEMLAPDEVIASPVNVGGGMVRTAHGLLPVPAPATALLLTGVPTYMDSELKLELCTPPGAALIQRFAARYGNQPLMTVSAIGYGMGSRDVPNRSNCVRAFIGEDSRNGGIQPNDEVTELECNIDDMTGEQLGYAAELLRKSGALDVSFIPITAKKNRPGYIITLMCKPEDEAKFAQLMLKHTTTFGVRGIRKFRYALEREFITRSDGVVIKHGWGFGVDKSKEEFDTLKREDL
ncbi:MAG: nickel pincer cofactor biosynthesis protein LarC [Oscillospiraceae bacterium]|jgi:uncharacterized protein (TIGR00299 family) protein|nr:nickel pincer cofactor biosynthesis protein LarC [Oscillospiraceae bacterium]